MSDKKLPPLRPRKPKVPPKIPDPERRKKKKTHIQKVEAS